MDTYWLAILSLLLPLFGAITARMAGHYVKEHLMMGLVTGLIGISWVLSCFIYRDAAYASGAIDILLYRWASVGGYDFSLGIWLDALTVLMMIVVTGISFLVHLYSIGYMADDKAKVRYFSYVSFFTFAMLLLVMGNNLLQVFIGWEGVGVASYLLIGFWQTKPYPAAASVKAFMVNRVGDMGLLVATGLLMSQFGDISFAYMLNHANDLLSSTWLNVTWVE